MEDKQIIDLYWSRNETAVHETAQKYGRYCHFIAHQILQIEADAEEAVNDTWFKAWNTIPPHRPTSLKGYVGMLTRQLSLDLWEKNHAQKRSAQASAALEELSECVADRASTCDPAEALALREALDRFIKTLPEKTRTVFLRRYWYACDLKQIAQSMGMGENHVSVLLYNTRKRLRAFLMKEGFSV